jgi:hypothetical protein
MRILPAVLAAFFLAVSSIHAAERAIAAVRVSLELTKWRVWKRFCTAPKRKSSRAGKKENREVWTVEGLVHPGLKRTLYLQGKGTP